MAIGPVCEETSTVVTLGEGGPMILLDRFVYQERGF